MLESLRRKARQLATDPVLRRWLLLRLLRRTAGEPPYTPHQPPYLQALGNGFHLPAEVPTVSLPELDAPPLDIAVDLPLPGTTVRVVPGLEGDLFTRTFADTEVLLAVHRFAWLPLLHGTIPDHRLKALVAAVWAAWARRYATPDDGWPWHPYTAAERAVNLLAFGRRHGLPAPVVATARHLAAHGPAIAARLEYFGDHHTSNHMANNGRGLYLLGLALGLPGCADLGGRILVEESWRIFRPSGILREESTHYHLLLTRAYAEAWLAARGHGRSEEAMLRHVTLGGLAVLPRLVLPGGLPLVGDISPDCPPEFLTGLLAGEDGGWLSWLGEDDRTAIIDLRDGLEPVDPALLATDGWLRADFGPWSGLWHAAPGGWSHMPGHGHQDLGAFELDYEDEAVFIDPGRGAYGDTGEAARYRSAAVHGLLSVDGADPYPPNRPYYDEAFRRRAGGAPPTLERLQRSVHLAHDGFGRLNRPLLGRKIGPVVRLWQFDGDQVLIADLLVGKGACTVTRRLVTPLPVERAGESTVIVRGERRTYRVTAERPVVIRPMASFTAYGRPEPATAIEVTARVRQPWDGSLSIEALR